jgi:hypothetical protein
MTKIERQGDMLVVEQTGWVIPGMGGFFAILGAAMMIVGLIGLSANGAAGIIVQGVITALVGVFLASIPGRRTTKIDASGGVSFDERSLLGTKRRTEEKVKGVQMIVAVYNAWVTLVFVDGPPVRVLVNMKTWTWQKDAPGLKKQAEEIAAFAGVPLS